MQRPAIIQVRVELGNVMPTVWREVEIPADASFAQLHEAVQVAMGWQQAHLYEFRVAGRLIGVPDRDDDGMVADARRMRVGEQVQAGSVIDYLYDFGDSWEHLLTVRSVTDAIPQTRYPRLVDGAMACPPEDVGGFPGYETFVDALANPRHPERRDMVEWWGSASFDPSAFDREAVETTLAGLRWSAIAS